MGQCLRRGAAGASQCRGEEEKRRVHNQAGDVGHLCSDPGDDRLVRVRPLEGITVVALEQVIAGPFATRQLAELGARVIKIERPDGGDSARAYDKTVKGTSSHFAWVNRSKESLTLNVKHPAAKAVLEKLLQKADVFLHNLAPGAVE